MIEPFFQALSEVFDPRTSAVAAFYTLHRDRLLVAKGSKTKHQAWEGGYADHCTELMKIAQQLFSTLHTQRPLPFSLGSAQMVLLFHDIEKLFAYSPPVVPAFDKEALLFDLLPSQGIRWSDDERNALLYVHGEGDDYDPIVRVMGPLAAFVHACDVISARIWYDFPKRASP